MFCKFNILRQQPERFRRDTMAVTGKGLSLVLWVHSSREGTLITSKNRVPRIAFRCMKNSANAIVDGE